MCLETRGKKPKKSYGIGWKLFARGAHGHLLGEFRGSYLWRPRQKWLRESDYRDDKHARIIASNNRRYPMGWHVFTTREDAESWRGGDDARLARVRYRKAHTKGNQDFRAVIVAKEIFIEKVMD